MLSPLLKTRPFDGLKTARFPKRKRVTLIAAFRSADAIALCADSQETITQTDARGTYELRATVQKITPITIGKYQVAIAGAGHASLIEAFIVRAQRAIEIQDAVVCSQENPASVSALHRALENELEEFYRRDVAACPDETKQLKLFIAGCCPLAQQYALWVSEGIVLRSAQSPELNGWEETLYKETAKRLASDGMTSSQAMLAAIYTLTIGKNTSNYIGGPLSVTIISKDGILQIPADYVQRMEDRLSEYEMHINRVFLACADTTTNVPDLEDMLDRFKAFVLNLHRNHIDEQARSLTIEDMFKPRELRGLPSLVTLMGTGALRVEHDRETIRKTEKEFKRFRSLSAGKPVKWSIHCQCGNDFIAEGENYNSLVAKGNIPCEKCGEMHDARRINLEDIQVD
jgi:hypothetical protein